MQVSRVVAQLKVSGNPAVTLTEALVSAIPALLPVKTVTSADGIIRIEARK